MTSKCICGCDNCFSSKGRTSEGKFHFTQQSAMAAFEDQEELQMWVEIVDELRQKHGRKPTPKQLAENTDMSIEDAKDILDAMPRFPPLKKSRVAAASDAETEGHASAADPPKGDAGEGAPKGGAGEGAPSAPSEQIVAMEPPPTIYLDDESLDVHSPSVAATQKYEPELPMAQRALSFSDPPSTPVHAKQALPGETPHDPELPGATQEACNLGDVSTVLLRVCVFVCFSMSFFGGGAGQCIQVPLWDRVQSQECRT